nr:MAG TPA: hypothetical protein [Caudoviricetes sp.]
MRHQKSTQRSRLLSGSSPVQIPRFLFVVDPHPCYLFVAIPELGLQRSGCFSALRGFARAPGKRVRHCVLLE